MKFMVNLFALKLFFFLSVKNIYASFNDQFLFKIVDQIYTLNEAKQIFTILQDLKCAKSDSLVLKTLPKQFLDIDKKKEKQIFKFTKSIKEKEKVFSPDQIYVFNILKRFVKIMTYVSGQNIVMDSDLKSLYLNEAKNRNCRYQADNNLLSKAIFDLYWERILKVEVFLKAQNLRKKSEEDKNLIQAELSENITFLINSIEKQIREEVYW